ncbi:MAG: YdcF family protein [bacterium]|nr:YdcF family protein [bacterium]
MFKFIGWTVAIFAIFILSTTLIISEKNQLRALCPNFENGNCAENFDAVVAISGGNTNSRTEEAIRIFKAVKAKKLIFSGANADPRVPSDAQQMANLAQTEGVAKSDILLEENAQNTRQNAQFSAEIIKQHGFKRVILTTSQYHQARAKLEFEKALREAGVEVISAPVSHDPDWNEFWWLSTRGWYLSMSELFGIFRFYVGE